MRSALPSTLLVLALVASAQPAAADDAFTATVRAGAAILAVGAQAAEGASGAARASAEKLSEEAWRWTERMVGIQGGQDPHLLAGAGSAHASQPCGRVAAVVELHRETAGHSLRLALGPGPDALQACLPRASHFPAARMQGDAERGWNGTLAAGAVTETLSLGPLAVGQRTPMRYAVFQAGALAYLFEGDVVPMT